MYIFIILPEDDINSGFSQNRFSRDHSTEECACRWAEDSLPLVPGRLEVTMDDGCIGRIHVYHRMRIILLKTRF